ncbi:unnamed protein product [Linum trigynum]|uniref:Uncharacterized protein n=1 Tax=Linum trigynum TaxID=586398 RepID=A0AAV2DQN1_9ROSI
MATRTPPMLPVGAGKPPHNTSGIRRPPEGSSTPDGKSAKETVQPKKKARALNLDDTTTEVEDAAEAEMDTDKEKSTKPPAWEGWRGKSFNEVVQ